MGGAEYSIETTVVENHTFVWFNDSRLPYNRVASASMIFAFTLHGCLMAPSLHRGESVLLVKHSKCLHHICFPFFQTYDFQTYG